jgi:hypothetical protein
MNKLSKEELAELLESQYEALKHLLEVQLYKSCDSEDEWLAAVREGRAAIRQVMRKRN